MERATKYYLAVCYSKIKTDSEGSEETDPVINAIRELSINELRNLRRCKRRLLNIVKTKPVQGSGSKLPRFSKRM